MEHEKQLVADTLAISDLQAVQAHALLDVFPELENSCRRRRDGATYQGAPQPVSGPSLTNKNACEHDPVLRSLVFSLRVAGR